LTNLLVAVNTYTERGRCLSNSFTEVGDLFRKNGISTNDMPFSLDQIKVNMDKNRYKRLDRFQDDVFALFNRVRAITRPDSQLFLDSIDLQKFFISKREELCKGVLVSPASAFTESDLWDEVEARKKAIKKEGSPANTDTNEVDSDADPSKAAMEVDEPEKPKVRMLF
jgi:protein polybromo-1